MNENKNEICYNNKRSARPITAPSDFKEEWKEYQGYFFSNTGKCRNKHGRIVEGYIRRDRNYQYKVVALHVNKKRVNVCVNQVVYKLFGKNYPKDTRAQVFNLDGDILNCAIWNLKICRAYTQEPTPQQIARYQNEVENCVLHIVKDKQLNKFSRLDVDNIIGETYLMIWRHLSQFMPNTSFYVFCKKYFMFVFKAAYKEYRLEIDNTVSFDDRRKAKCED